MVFDMPNTVWTLASAYFSALVDGPCECLDRVYGFMKGQAQCKGSLTNSTSIFLLHGAVNSVAHGFYTVEHYILTSQSPSPPLPS